MALSETVEINGKKFTATVLTVKQIREVLHQIEGEKYISGLIDRLFVDGLPEPAFYLSLGIKEDDIAELTPEDVKTLMEAVASVNPTYAAMEKNMAANIANLESLRNSLKEAVSS